MSENDLIFEFSIPEQNFEISVKTPSQFEKWIKNEHQNWEWLNDTSIFGPDLSSALRKHDATLREFLREWRQNENQPERVFERLRLYLKKSYGKSGFFGVQKQDREFLIQLNERYGAYASTGAFAFLFGKDGQQLNAAAIGGVIQGFLYKNNIDWSASIHGKVLEELATKFDAIIKESRINIEEQNARIHRTIGELEGQITKNENILEELKHEKSSKFEHLYQSEVDRFNQLRDEHVKNLNAIESTYDQKLALQKPVEYWKAKAEHHSNWSIKFGWISLSAFVAALFGVLVSIRQVFSDTTSDSPNHIELSTLLIVVFFSIWIVRILVRLFFSHLHLSTDAHERRIMILTYLSMSREGSQFGPEDKRLIVQHLFRSASDGLVKDDAAPPSILEYLSRK